MSDDRTETPLWIEPQRPNPGSDAAIAAGCTCPVLDNGHGRGYMGNPARFVFNEECPVHFPRKEPSHD